MHQIKWATLNLLGMRVGERQWGNQKSLEILQIEKRVISSKEEETYTDTKSWPKESCHYLDGK